MGLTPQAINARKGARRLAMQALYQWQLAGTSVRDIQSQFKEQEEYARVDQAYFCELVSRVPECKQELLEVLPGEHSRAWENVDPVELAVLLIGLYELRYRLDIPYRAVLNEAVNLAKKFGAEQSYKFINGLLDKAARVWRALEVNAAAGRV